MNWWNRKKVRNTLGVTEPVLNALVRSGLLGYTSPSVLFADHAVRSYQRFGTQWAIDGRYGPTERILEPEVYENAPPVEGIGPQPPGTRAHGYLWQDDGLSGETSMQHAADTDTSWIAHFYLVTNRWCFPNLTDLALIGPSPLELSGPKRVPGADLPVTLYPHPSGYLGLVAVEGSGSPLEAFREGYDVAMPLLDELSAHYDVPLPVAHSMAVGIPSGMIHLDFSHPSKARRIDDDTEVLPRCPYPELRDAYALYREAVSSNNPFHAFLTFWKVYEEAVYVRRGRGAKYKRGDTKVMEEVCPDLFAFGARPEELATPPEDDIELMRQESAEQLRGQKFERAREFLRGPYRAAVAHAGKVDTGKPLTAASYADYLSVASKVAVVRYMANVVLRNVRATFDADSEREAEEGAGAGSTE